MEKISIEDIDNTVGQNQKKAGLLGAEEIYNLQRFGIKCLIKKGEQDVSQLYYEIDVNELMQSSLPVEYLKDLQNLGFSYLDDTKKKIVKYIELI